MCEGNFRRHFSASHVHFVFQPAAPFQLGGERKEAERVPTVPAAQEARFLEEPAGETRPNITKKTEERLVQTGSRFLPLLCSCRTHNSGGWRGIPLVVFMQNITGA